MSKQAGEKKSLKADVKELQEVLAQVINGHNQLGQSIQVLAKAITLLEHFMVETMENKEIIEKGAFRKYIENKVKSDEKKEARQTEQSN